LAVKGRKFSHYLRRSEASGFVTNIFVVDDNQLMRQQALRLLEQQDSWQVSGEAVNGKDAVSKYRDLLPDVTVMDFEMPEMNGLDAARAILKEHPSAAILMLSVHLPGQLAVEARKIGIKGACPKSEMWCLPDAIRALLRGETYFPH
jgi:two-component system chemotaxis response regulator CheY